MRIQLVRTQFKTKTALLIEETEQKFKCSTWCSNSGSKSYLKNDD